MLLTQVGGQTRSFGAQDSNEYMVANSAVIMNLLSKSLYKDQIKAPIRELSTNAWDAHVMAGTMQIPFDIYLPTCGEPTFKIRDYGTGLSQESMVKLYRIYGVSDKSNSNEFNGCMGIGSKSPFAYTNMFNSTSYYNGMQYSYVNSKDEYGKPKLQLMYEGETDEPNGFEVEFSVKQGDIYTFEQRAHELFQWFPIKPIIKRGNHPSYDQKDIAIEGDDWRINAKSTESFAIMGYIAYPIEPHHFTEKLEVDARWYSRYGDCSPYVQMLNSGIELDFNIGDIEMDASREGLQYTKKTINAIKAKLDIVRQEVNDKVESEICGAKNLWAARCAYNDLTNSKFKSFTRILESGKVLYDGQDINSVVDIAKLNIIWFHMAGRVYPKQTKTNIIIPGKRVRIYLNDVKTGARAAIVREMCKEPISPHLVSIEESENLAAIMGCDTSEFIKISSLPKPPKQKGAINEKVLLFNILSSNKKEAFKSTEVNFEDGGYYFEINRHYVRNKAGNDLEHNQIKNLISYAKILGLIDDNVEIYGVKTCTVDKYHKAPQWENIFDVLKQSAEEYVVEQDIAIKLAQINSYANMSYNDMTMLSTLDKHAHFPASHKISQIISIYKEYKKINDSFINILDKIKFCCIILGVTIGDSQVKSVYEMYQDFLANYPMVILIDTYDINAQKDVVINYIKLVDSNNLGD